MLLYVKRMTHLNTVWLSASGDGGISVILIMDMRGSFISVYGYPSLIVCSTNTVRLNAQHKHVTIAKFLHFIPQSPNYQGHYAKSRSVKSTTRCASSDGQGIPTSSEGTAAKIQGKKSTITDSGANQHDTICNCTRCHDATPSLGTLDFSHTGVPEWML